MVYIGRSINSEPLDQTNLKERRRCKPQGGGESTFKGGGRQVGLGAGWFASGASRPHLAASRPLLRWFASWSHLKPSRVIFVADKRD
jgi:hypothetical protein